MENIQSFLAIKNIAVIGLSRDPKDFSRTISADLERLGYKIIPINPNTNEIAGEKCYANLTSAEEKIEGILVFTRKEGVKVIEEAISLGIKHIWLRNFYTSAKELVDLQNRCNAQDINFVFGYCPYMFLQGDKFPHNIHKFISKATLNYPK